MMPAAIFHILCMLEVLPYLPLTIRDKQKGTGACSKDSGRVVALLKENARRDRTDALQVLQQIAAAAIRGAVVNGLMLEVMVRSI